MRPGAFGPEEILEVSDRRAGVEAFLVIDSTRLGPAFGGIRVRPYPLARDALLEAIDLAAAMTLKAALAGLPCGGGKIVLIQRPGLRPARAWDLIGRTLESLEGRFFAGRDYGMTREDLEHLRRISRYAAEEPPYAPRGLRNRTPRPSGQRRKLEEAGNEEALQSLADATARGTLAAIRAALAFAHAKDDAPRPAAGAQSRSRQGPVRAVPRNSLLGGMRVSVQGLGAVGLALVGRLVRAGALVTAADTDPASVRRGQRAGARIVSPELIAAAPADIFVPAALGGLLDEAFARRCRARIVCGPANNALSSAETEGILLRRNIVFVPDILAGAGALIAGALRALDGISDPGPAIDAIGPRAGRLLRACARSGQLPSAAARALALRRLGRGAARAPARR